MSNIIVSTKVFNTVEPLKSGQWRPNSVQISELRLVQHTNPGKRTRMGTYSTTGSIPFFGEYVCVFSMTLGRSADN